MIELKGLEWTPAWTSHIGCMHGCSKYLDLGLSLPEVFGATGHAFIINVHEQLCPSGPTAWKSGMLSDLSPNIGLRQEVIFGFRGEGNFKKLQKESWKFVRGALDNGKPCYGWELAVPEFYVIKGYTEKGYLASGPGVSEDTAAVPWEFLDASGTGVAEFYSCARCEPASDRKILFSALSASISHADNSSGWILNGYHSGPEAFRVWQSAIKQKEESPWGTAYNAEVWAECRNNGVLFLKEISQRFDSDIRKRILESAELYGKVLENLEILKSIYPFRGPGNDPEVTDSDRSAALEALSICHSAESEASDAIRELAAELA
jgi:hypothetical protein